MTNEYTELIKELYRNGKRIAGVDEVGRGSVFGPVVAAAVILPEDFYEETIKDSKKVSQKNRQRLAEIIKKNATAFAITEISPELIDEVNILQATFLAMSKALAQLNPQPDMVMVDGHLTIPNVNYDQIAVIKGDAKVFAISCASILAKNYTDELMTKLDLQYPGYDLANSKGYGSSAHFDGVKKYGITPLHRKTYKSVTPYVA